jgi:YHS domain-containing protein
LQDLEASAILAMWNVGKRGESIMAKDPVCGKEIDEAAAREEVGRTAHGARVVDPQAGTRRFHEGKWYSFCSVDCRSRFMANPSQYVEK